MSTYEGCNLWDFFLDFLKEREKETAEEVEKALNEIVEEEKKYCQAGMDGDCFWKKCPQIRDGEPETSGRHCPLDTREWEA